LIVPEKEDDGDLYDLSEPAPTAPSMSARPAPAMRPAATTIKAPGMSRPAPVIPAPVISRPAATTVAKTQAAMSSRSEPQSAPSLGSTQSGARRFLYLLLILALIPL